MSKLKILQVTTYDLETPDHGGKLRSFNIRKQLREEFDVETLSFEWTGSDAVDRFSIKLNRNNPEAVKYHWCLTDWSICNYIDAKPEFENFIFDKVSCHRPDVVLLEQPFLWPVVRKMCATGVLDENIFVIYSSHNIEYILKESIYNTYFEEQLSARYVEYVKLIEFELIARANLIFAVSDSDSEFIIKLKNEVKVLTFSNGHSSPRNLGRVSHWKSEFTNTSRCSNWVFVGSWHTPNMNGLLMLINSLQDLKANCQIKLWIFGSAGDGLRAVDGFEPERFPFVQLIGKATNEDIESAIQASSGVVLPIWEGGGSNLKTAQALLSEKCVIGSSYSFRGFEKFADEPGVYVFDSAPEMVEKMNNMKTDYKYERTRSICSLEWEHILIGMPTLISEELRIQGRST